MMNRIFTFLGRLTLAVSVLISAQTSAQDVLTFSHNAEAASGGTFYQANLRKSSASTKPIESTVKGKASAEFNRTSDYASPRFSSLSANDAVKPWQNSILYKTEVTQYRDRTSKHFLCADGNMAAFLSSGTSLHYLDEGVWKDIDNSIEPSQTPDYVFESTRNQFKTFYSDHVDKGIKLKLLNEEVILKANFSMGYVSGGEHVIKYEASNFLPVNHLGSAIRYNQVLPGVDFASKQLNDGIKYDFIVNDNQTFSEVDPNNQDYFISQRILLPAGCRIKSEFGSTETGNAGKIASITVENSKGIPILKFEMPYYYDSATNADGVFGWYQYELSNNELTLSSMIPSAWAASTERVFPLVIDPVVSIFPDISANWSGSVRNNGTNNENASGAFMGRSGTSGYWHYWAKFNNSSIPDGSTINSVSGNFYRTGVVGGFPVAVCRLDFDPPAQTGLNIFNGIVAATGVYITSTTYAAGTGWTAHPLGASGASDLAASLGSDYFSIGLRTLTTTAGNVGRIHTHNQANPPYLTVDYTPGGPPSTPACFQSVTSGNWEDASTWESRDNCTGGWVPATSTPGANSLGVLLQSGHHVTVNTSISCSLMTVQSGSSLIVATGGTLTVSNGTGTDLDVSGTLQSTGGTIATTGGALINISGAYIHAANGGSLPTATWQDGSTCRISGMTTTTPANLTQNFYDFIWDSPAQTGNAILTGTSNPSNVRGVFEYRPAGGGLLDLSNINRVWTGNFYVGSVVALMRGSASGTSSLTINNLTINDVYNSNARLLLNNSTSTAVINANLFVKGDVLINPTSNLSPAISFNTFGSSNFPIALLDVEGDFTLNNGLLTGAPNVAPNNTQNLLRFNGAGTKVFTKTGGSMNQVNVSVFSPAVLDMGNSVLDNTGNFTLTAGASLRIGHQQGIVASGSSGNIQNAGGSRTFNSACSYIYYNAYGSGAQQTGDGLPSIVNTLVCENAQGTTLTNSTVSVNTEFSVSGLFILEESKALIQGPASVLTGVGQVRVIRTGNASAEYYNFWSAPVSPVSLNVLGGSNRFYYDPASGTPSTADDTFDPGWQTATGTMQVGRGYIATGAGEVVFNGSPGNAPTGSPITADVSLPASNTGFNLIGNPFPSAINAAAFLNDNAGIIDGTVWLWDQGGTAPFISSDYATINALGATSGGGTQVPAGYISSGQAFFVNRSIAGTAQAEFRNTQRTAAGNSQFFNYDEIVSHRLSLINPDVQYNELLIGFKEDASTGFDPLYDARKLIGNYQCAFYSILNEEPFSIQGFSLEFENVSIPLGFITGSAGTHQIQLKDSEGSPEGHILVLEDRLTGVFRYLAEGNTYLFESEAGTFNDRFILHTMPEAHLEAFSANCTDSEGSALLQHPNWQAFEFELTSLNSGSSEQGFLSGTSTEFARLSPGFYQLNLLNSAVGYHKQLFFEIGEVLQQAVTIQSNANSQINLGEILHFEANLIDNSMYLWDFGDGTQVEGTNVATHQYPSPGIYTLHLQVSNQGCVSEAMVELVVIDHTAGLGWADAQTPHIRLWPLPAKNELFFALPDNTYGKAEISIFDASGRLVRSFEQHVTEQPGTIPLSEFQDGLYLISILIDNKLSAGKFMVSRIR